ncbi:hypothetical protein L6452_14404 [Arctium lappa]|uniref:Uncharacterized protein n=1 Tax=Arctium lappa TaxID=4217 RepID=A0ACB9CLD3_ARCLA|nr:hypothetical protein L6452_14404 [Arctium lappa]
MMDSEALLIENGSVTDLTMLLMLLVQMKHMCVMVEMSSMVIVGVVVVRVAENRILEAWVSEDPSSTTKNGYGGMDGYVVSGDQ